MNLHLIIALVVTTWAGLAKSDGCSSCPIDGDHDHCDDVYNPPPRIQIDPGMCDKISDLPTEQTKLCKKYEKHPGYYVSCSSQGMTFSCKASCGVKVEDVGKNFTINDKLKDIMSNGLLLGLNTPHEKHEDLLSDVGFGGDLLSFPNHPATPEHNKAVPVQANNAGHANPFNQNLLPQGAYDVYQPLIIPNQQNQQQPHTNFNFNPLPQPGHSFPSGPPNFPGSPFFHSNIQHPAPAAPAAPLQRPGSPFLPTNVNQQPASQVKANSPKPNPAPHGPVVNQPVLQTSANVPQPGANVPHSIPSNLPVSPFFPSNVQHPAPAAPAAPVQRHGSPSLPLNLNPGYHPAPQSEVKPAAHGPVANQPVLQTSANVPQPWANVSHSIPSNLPVSPFVLSNVQHPAPAAPVQHHGSPSLPLNLNPGYQSAPEAKANSPKTNPTVLGPLVNQPVPQPGANIPQHTPTLPPRGPGSPFLPIDLDSGYQPASQASANAPETSPSPHPSGPGSPFLPTDLNAGYQPAPQGNTNSPQAGANVPRPTPTQPPHGPESPFLPTDLNAGYQPAHPANANVPQPTPTQPPHGPGSPFLPTDLNAGYQPAPPANANVPQAGANVPQPTPTQPPHGPGSPFLPTDLNAGYQPAPQGNSNSPQAGANVPQPTPTQPTHGPGSPLFPTHLNTGYHSSPPVNVKVSIPNPTTFSPTPSVAGSQFLSTDLEGESGIPANPTPQAPKVNPGSVNPALQSNAGTNDDVVLSHPVSAGPAAAVVNDHHVFQPNAQTGFLPTVLANKESISANKLHPGENHADHKSEPVSVNPLNSLPTHVASDATSSLLDPKNVLSHAVNNIPASIPKSSLPAVSNPSVIRGLPSASASNSAIPQNSVHQHDLLSGLTNNAQASHQSQPSLPSNLHGSHTSGLASAPSSGPASGHASNPVSGPDSHSNFGPLVSTHVDPSHAEGYTGFTGFDPFPGHANFHSNGVAHPAPHVPTLPDLRLPNVPEYNSIHGNAGPQNPPARAGPKSGGDPFFGFGFGTYGGNNGYQNLGGFNNNNNHNINNNFDNNHLGHLTDSLHKQMNDLKDTSASGAKTLGTSSSTNTGKSSSSSNINSYNTGSSNADSTSGGSSTHDLGGNNNAGHHMTHGNDLFTGFGNTFSGQGGATSGNHGNGFHANPVSHSMFNQLSNHQGYFQGYQPFNNFMTPTKTENKHQPVSKSNIFSNGLFDFMGRRR